MTFAVIAARGGSKRLPRKNVLALCGHPLIAWTITQARCSKNIDKVFVTTDDDEIADIAKAYGAEVIDRPEWPDADAASAMRPIAHAIQVLLQKYGKDFEIVVPILPTNPLNLPDDFDKAIEMFHAFGADLLVPLIPRREVLLYKRTSRAKAYRDVFSKNYDYLGEAGAWEITRPMAYLTRKNSLEVDDDKAVDSILKANHDGVYYMPVNRWQYADVDTMEEFELATVLMEHYILKGEGMKCYEDYKAGHIKEGKSIVVSFGNSKQIGETK